MTRRNERQPNGITDSTSSLAEDTPSELARQAASRRMRVAEKCLLVFFAYTAAACWLFPLGVSQRLAILALNAVAA